MQQPGGARRRNTSTAHSLVISGSLYVLTTDAAAGPHGLPDQRVGCRVTDARVGAAASRSACEVTQFWQ